MSDRSPPRRGLRAGARTVRAAAREADAGVQRARRLRLLTAVRAAAFRVYAEVDVRVAPDVLLGSGIRVTVAPNTRNRLWLGANARLGDRVRIMLNGGAVELGERAEMRRDVVANVSGEFRMGRDSVISWASVVHCSQRVELAEMAGVAEQVTIADSSHYWTTPDQHFWHNVRSGEVYIGRNTWVCPKATLTRGARIGDYCLVASNSVVLGDVPDASFASGIPVQVRPLSLPWSRPAGGD